MMNSFYKNIRLKTIFTSLIFIGGLTISQFSVLANGFSYFSISSNLVNWGYTNLHLFTLKTTTCNTFRTIDDTIKKELADMDLRELANVIVSPFEISTSLDSGYRASNSISGSRFDAPVRELPFAIQAFTSSFIKDQKPINIFDVARYSPGVTYRSNDFNEGNANMAIRGFAIGSLAGGNIHILRDGFHGPSIFDFTNISRVEVVKGPASFLYGQVAPGGIVNIITKSPRSVFEANAGIRYGSYNQYRYEADITGPATKTLYYRVCASYEHDMQYWKPYNANSRNISPSLLWKPHKRVRISLKFEHFYKDEEPQVMQKPGYNTQAGLLPKPSDPNLSGIDVPGLPDNWNSMSYTDFRRSKTNGLSAWSDLKVNDNWDIRAGYSYQMNTIDALFSGNLGMSKNTTYLQGRRLRRQIYTNFDNTLQVDVIGKYDFGRAKVRLFLGGQYGSRLLDREAGQAPNDPALGNDPIASPLPLWNLRDPSTWNRTVTIPLVALTTSQLNQTITYIDKSVYAGTTFGFFNENLLILAGGRYTSTNSRLTDNLTTLSEPGAIASMIIPQFAILYKLTRRVSLFTSYSESFVPGTFQLNNIDGTTSTAKPTKGYGYDIGIKTDLWEGALSGTATFFNILNKNIVNDLSTTNNAGTSTIYNVQSGEQRSRGIELDATITATANWQLYLSYSYTDARIIKFSENDEAILAQDTSVLDAAARANYKNVNRFYKAPLQMSAPHLANLWTRYNFTQYWLQRVYIAGGANFVYNQTLLPDSPEASRQTYTLINVTIGYSWVWHKVQISVDITGKNLANEHYRPSQSTRSRPGELLVSLSVRF
jgi:iron complex outermembrane receptor protein